MFPPTQLEELFAASESNDGSEAQRDAPLTSQDSGARAYGDSNIDLPEELQNALLSLAQEAQRQDLYQRRIEVMRDRRNRFYERGIQHIYEDIRSGIFVQGTPGALVPDPGGDGMIQCGQFLNDYDIFGRALQIIIAKLTENPVGVNFQPDSADNSADLQASEAAEGYRLLYDRRNDCKELLTAIVRMMGLSGRTITWTRTLADAQKWGTDEQGRPRRVQVTTVYGTLETKVPVMAKCMADWPYCIITEDPHLYVAKSEHPDFADKIDSQGDDGVADTQFERMARIGALQGNSASFQITDTYNWYVERKYCWFRPSMFMDKSLDAAYFDEQHADESDGWTLRDALREAFPDGCCVTFIGNQYVGSRNVSMDDELNVDFPYAGDGMSRRAIMDPAVVIQDDFNDDMNNYHEVKVVGWPSIWVNQDVKDLAAINDQVAAPYCFRALKTQPSREAKMGEQFYREPDPSIPESFMRHTEYMETQLLQYILAIPSAVQGAGMPDQKLMDVDEPIPTPKGFVRNGDLRSGDIVFGQDGVPYRITKAHPIVEVDAFRVTFDDGTEVLVHSGHLWKTFTRDERRKKRPGKVRTTQEIAETLLVGKEITKMGLCLNHTVPIPDAVQMPKRNLPLDPYCLGAWLGDGNTNGGCHASDKDGPQILKHFAEAGFPFKRLKSPNDWSIEGLTGILEAIGVRRRKHIPIVYLWASAEQRLSLLQGLMDTDGNCSIAGRARFTNTNLDLAQGVYHIACSLGIKAFFRTEYPVLNGIRCAPAHWVEWTDTVPVFRLARKLRRIRKSVQKWRYISSVTSAGPKRMRCLTTENPEGLYLFGKNFNVTHNTASGYMAALNQALGQLGVIWGAVQRLMAGVYRQAALAAARDDQEQKAIVIPGPKGSSVTVDMASLGKGRFLCHPDVDSGYPESTVQKRSTLASILEMAAKNPMLAQALFQSPDNWDFFARTMGIPEITLPEAKARRKQIAEIEILLQQSPIGPTPEEIEIAQAAHAAQMMLTQAGGAGPASFDPQSLMRSSIQPDPLDFHEWEFEECREFLSDYPKVQQQINAGNEVGVKNVRLHAMEHQKFIAQQAAAVAQAQAAAQPKPAPSKSGEQPEKSAENQPQTQLQ